MTPGGELMAHWGYAAIVVMLVLGNVGLPVPEETTLIVAGYLAWRGDLQLPWVLGVGVVSAAVGDNIGYWLGRRYGAGVLERLRRLVRVAPERFESMRGFVIRHGPVGVFGARFIAGLRFLAGPLAGAVGVRFLPFTTANVLGALVFVPVMVGLGYAGGYGLGDHVERILQMTGRVEHLIVIAALIFVAAIVVRRVVVACHEK